MWLGIMEWCTLDAELCAETVVQLGGKPAARKVPLASTPPEPECALEQCEIAPIAHLSTPPETKAPITCAHQELNHEPHQPSNAPIMPPSETRDPTALPEAPLEDIISPMVSDDLKHQSHFSVLIPEPSAVSEVHYAMPSNQSMSMHYLLVTDNSALSHFPHTTTIIRR
ncbi:hypothetical protein BD769DRAFT_1661454 [Suillus cothurnatus]|nr:hypothetical protein BD769DRAFT_1661454 [Suillus cothurnatus]